MPQTARGPPPPAPRYLAPPVRVDSPSSSESGGDNRFDRLETTFVPSKNVLVEGRFDESTNRPMIYLDTKVIMETRFNIDRGETGFYRADIIYILAVDGLNCLKDATGRGVDNFSPPSEELLQKCKEESRTCLMAALSYSRKRENDTSALLWEKKEAWALERERIAVTLLHGEHCTIWKVKDPLKRERIGCGILSFGGFTSFSVKRTGNEPQYFTCRNKDILSGKFNIEKTKNEAGGGGEAEEKAGWQVIVK